MEHGRLNAALHPCTSLHLRHRSTESSSRWRTAFTLFELLLVLALLLTFTALAFPALNVLLRQQKDHQRIAEVRRSLQLARQRAIDDGHPVRWQSPGQGIENLIIFQPTGMATDARIEVQGPQGPVGVIVVIGATGSIRLEDSQP